MQQIKTYLLFLTAFAFLPCMLFAQQAPAIEWQHCYGGSYNDGGNAIIKSHDAEKYVFAAGTVSIDGDVPNAGAWVCEVNTSGTIWNKSMEGGSATNITRTADGGYAVCGVASSDRAFSNFHGGSWDAFVAKLDYEGKFIWGKCLGGSREETAYSVIESNDEGRDLIICATTNSTDGDVSGLHIGTSIFTKPNDVWIVRMSSSGNIRWQKCFGGTSMEIVGSQSIIQTKDGGFIFACETQSIDGDIIGNHLDLAGHNNGDFWIVKLNGSGAIQWQKCLGGSFEEIPNSIIQTSDGGYAIAGSTNSDDGDVSGLHKSGPDMNHKNGWIAKLNSSGLLQWQKCLGGEKQDGPASIIQTSSGDYVIAGWTNSNSGDILGNHGENDAWIVKLGALGALKWQHCYGGKGSDGASSIIETSDGGYIFIGGTTSFDGDVSGVHDISYGDVWIVKLEPDIENVVNYSSAFITDNVKIYPNPSATETHFSLNANYSLLTAGFYDIMGRQYFPNYTLDNNLINCDVHDLPSGIYLARLPWTSLKAWQDGKYAGSFTVPFLVQH
jgi:hypothetical protein